jgi:hypothetical protein
MLILTIRFSSRNLDKGVKKQIKYYKNYVRPGMQRVKFYGVVGATEIDGRRDLHAALVRVHTCVDLCIFSKNSFHIFCGFSSEPLDTHACMCVFMHALFHM